MKGLRGTPFDPFGYSIERRKERALIDEYKAMVLGITDGTEADAALELANLPEGIRGFGHVKALSIAEVEAIKRKHM
jgi:indolepyruvate ferredoxin oxidoreductase